MTLGIIRGLYSPWVQDSIRKGLVERINREPGIESKIESLSIGFPLDVKIGGVMLVQNGDTMIAAKQLNADVALMPLLAGKIDVKTAFLERARYQMGNADSLMMMVIKADTIKLQPATVSLSPLDITLEDGRIAHGSLSMISKVDTLPTPNEDKEQTDMLIKVNKLSLEDFTYQMSLLPSIDSLGANIGNGLLTNAEINLKNQTVDIGGFTGSHLNASYIAPTAEQIAATPIPPVAETDTASLPWTIKIDSIHFTNSYALYTTKGYKPLPGLDFAYIEAYDMDLSVHNFFDQGALIELPFALKAKERCGVELDASGTFSMDSVGMRFNNMKVSTPNNTDLYANGMMGAGDMTTDPKLPLQLEANGGISPADIMLMFPAVKPYIALLPSKFPINLDANILGTPSDLNIYKANLEINRCVNLKAKGRVFNVFSKYGPTGNISFSGNIINVSSIINDLAKGSGLTIPPMTLDGHAAIKGANVDATLHAKTMEGTLALVADFNRNSEGYELDINTKRFPVNAFMKDLGIGLASIDLHATGNGFDLFDQKTNLDAKALINSLTYNDYNYTGIVLDASIHDGNAIVDAKIDNDDIAANINANGNLNGNTYDWTCSIDGNYIDLQALNFMKDRADISINAKADAVISPLSNEMDVRLRINDINFTDEITEYDISNIIATFASCDTLTTFTLTNRDFIANAYSPSSLDSIMTRASALSELIDYQIKERKINADSLQKVLPHFTLNVHSGSDNFINDILRKSKMSLSKINLDASNDSVIRMRGRAIGLNSKTMSLDTIGIYLKQKGEKMQLIGRLDNQPGTYDDFAHIKLDCMLNLNQIAIRATQQNIQLETGYDIGAIASLSADTTILARIFPLNPVIGYKKWSVNFDNYIKYNIPTKQVAANLKMKGEKSSLALYTESHTDSLGIKSPYNDIILKIGDIQLADWISINPFAPPITGILSADMKMQWNGADVINGDGVVSLNDFTYNRENVGSFESNINVYTNTSGLIRAKADLSVNGVKTMTIAGNLNDSTAISPINLDFSVIRFPLSIANPFLPEGVARLSGTLNGEMEISGDSDNPVLNGKINFQDAAIKAYMTNTSYRFSAVEIPVDNSIVTFNDFGINGVNENPLLVNGTVDISSISSPKFDLDFKAKNMMVVNTNKAAKNAEIYGKGYLNIDASVKGSMAFMDIDADVSLLSGSNITYILSDAASTLQSPTETDMVKFVNFTDSTAVLDADSIANNSMLMMINANLNIESGTMITVNLNTSPRDKVQVQPEGALNYTLSPATDGRLIGRITINSGFARYTLPVIGSEKEFTFVDGSYIAFNGDMLNPVLNIKANDIVKANVTQEGQNSRLVNFDIGLAVSGTLSTMDVSFDLSTSDDLTVANELQSMTAEQRANQAMNMLLYNMYTGPGTKASANLTANPLFSFLESQVNNWAANNIKGVDLTFGIDQYNQTINGSKSSTMNYSYQVSKSLFNDRFKIVVGGNYSTDADADENLSENLFNDISFEYYLNKRQTMLIKIFRHTGYESILEGEITQTGVGFVYKRKLNRLVQILPRFMRPKKYRSIVL